MKEKLAMPCTEQQWEQEIKPRIEKIQGVRITDICNFNNYPFLINNYLNNNDYNAVSNITALDQHVLDNNRVLIPYDPDRFCASLGEVKGFPEKWAVKDTEEATRFIEKLSNDGIFKPCGFGFSSLRFNEGYLCFMSKNVDLRVFDTIQYGYTEVTLDQLKAHYEEQPKWMPLTRGGIRVKEVIKFGERLAVWGINEVTKNGSYWFCGLDGLTNGCNNDLDLIPHNPKIEAIKQEIAIKEKELEELKSRLNK